MSFRITNCKPSLTSGQLESVEHDLAIRLPDQYRQFLLAHNGGVPEPSIFHFKHEHGPYADSCVDYFLAIYDGEYNNFEVYFKRYKTEQVRLPPELVPIAHDPGGNLVCIAVDGPRSGSIYFWDHEREVGDGELPSYSNVHLVADSFDEFLNSLSDTV